MGTTVTAAAHPASASSFCFFWQNRGGCRVIQLITAHTCYAALEVQIHTQPLIICGRTLHPICPFHEDDLRQTDSVSETSYQLSVNYFRYICEVPSDSRLPVLTFDLGAAIYCLSKQGDW